MWPWVVRIRWTIRPAAPQQSAPGLSRHLRNREGFPGREPCRHGIEGRISIIASELPGCLPGLESLLEARRLQAIGAGLLGGGTNREIVGVFVLGMTAMAPHPHELHLVIGQQRPQLLPHRQVLDRAALAGPAAPMPARRPL